jgi:hypothetical protein
MAGGVGGGVVLGWGLQEDERLDSGGRDRVEPELLQQDEGVLPPACDQEARWAGYGDAEPWRDVALVGEVEDRCEAEAVSVAPPTLTAASISASKRTPPLAVERLSSNDTGSTW